MGRKTRGRKTRDGDRRGVDHGGGGGRHREGETAEERTWTMRKGREMGTGEWAVEEAGDDIEKGEAEAQEAAEEERTRSTCPEEAEEGRRSMWRWGRGG